MQPQRAGKNKQENRNAEKRLSWAFSASLGFLLARPAAFLFRRPRFTLESPSVHMRKPALHSALPTPAKAPIPFRLSTLTLAFRSLQARCTFMRIAPAIFRCLAPADPSQKQCRLTALLCRPTPSITLPLLGFSSTCLAVTARLGWFFLKGAVLAKPI
ncbi:hypothetical protein GQ54DRAFT_88317 [Martensiomyces pterosporus]|nr:hypothetical protein GQ54DRAFT_88317 [Martensiomyces pterosporus]